MRIDLDVIEDAAASIAASATRIKDGVAALRAQIDPTAQTRVNAVGAVLADAATELRNVADGLAATPPAAPPPPPTGPPA